MPPTITPSLHALRHPNRPAQISRNRRVGVSAAGKAESSLKRAYAKQLRIKFNEQVDKFFTEHDELVAALAKEFRKKERNVRALLCNETQYKTVRTPSLRNAVIHQRWRDLQEDGEVKRLQDICAELKEEIEDGTFSLDDIDDAEAKRLIKQLLEHWQLKRRGVRVTTKAAQLDGFQTAKGIGNALLDLYERTGIRGIAIFSRRCTDDPGIPHAVDSDNAMEFMEQELDIVPLDFLRKFKHWCVRQDEDEPDENGVNPVRKEVSRLVLEGLRIITKIATITMEWVNYDVTIREARGVELAGVPHNIPLGRPATWNVETARRFRDGLRNGSIHWVEMTKTQREELKAEHNARRKEMGVGSLVKKAERSDKGKTRPKKTNGEKAVEVQTAATAAAATRTPGGAGAAGAGATVFAAEGAALPGGAAAAEVVYPQLIGVPQDNDGLPLIFDDVPVLTMDELDAIELGMQEWFGPQPTASSVSTIMETLALPLMTPAPHALPQISARAALVPAESVIPTLTLPHTNESEALPIPPTFHIASELSPAPLTTDPATHALRFISFSAPGNPGSKRKRNPASSSGASTGNCGAPLQKRRKRADAGKSRAEWEAEKAATAASKENMVTAAGQR
ncbi:hypothetical protein K438DRAFT_1786392 [Mycena galopus ATCC 62051]|nr:hypothetical protein K438DRAFT_1786392 [Mycena galopus ATCC 62051]